MKIITDLRCTAYSHQGHPERPNRIASTADLLRQQTDIPIDWMSPSAAPDEALLRAHSPEHLKRLTEHEEFDVDTPYYERIAEFARCSAGAALDAVKLARNGEIVFSLMRPPGHHATRNRAMGFCYLNNAAIATLEALATGTQSICVFDFDVHHGNGTEAILMNHPGASFISVHQHPCYPGTGTRNMGNNCFNYPMLPRTPRAEYLRVLSSALHQLRQLKPEVVIVSAGFDTYARDPLAQEMLENEDFQWLGTSMRELGLPVANLLEGGYSEELPQLILAYLKGLAGQ